MSNRKCQNNWWSQIGPSHVCAMAEALDSTTCNGDSGGELMLIQMQICDENYLWLVTIAPGKLYL